MDKFISYLLNTLTVLFVIAICFFSYVLVSQYTSDKFTLTKSNWVCSQTVKEKELVMVGKTLFTNNIDKCIEYKRVN